jgi:DNA-binding GntR family transcriptional regulator
MLLYQQIRNHLQEKLRQGDIQPGVKLPSERTLQEQFQSTRITVREALMRLEAEGLIYSQKRRGWFVTPNKLKWQPAKKVNFNRLAQEQGFTPSTRVIELLRLPDNQDCQHFSAGELYCLRRVRTLDSRPVMYEVIHCEVQRFAKLEQQVLDGSITEIMSSVYGIDIDHEHCVISVTVLPDQVAAALEKNSGAPCLRIERARFSKQNQLIDFNLEYWLHDAIEMLVDGR